MIKKICKYLLFVVAISLFSTNIVSAASLKINASASTVYVDQTVKIYLNINELSGRFRVSSSDNSVLDGGAGGWCDNNVCTDGMSTTIIFKAKKAGKATIKIEPVNVSITTPGQEDDFTESRSITINVVNKATIPSIDVNKTYSKNNYLKSLSVDGYEITPEFTKDKLEYEVELEPGTEEIDISATLEDKNASVKGAGKVKITEGINTIKIVVTAENGNERTYQIIANSPEKDPINVKIEEKKYTVVKKRELIGSKSGYEESEEKINGFEIPSLYNDVTKVTLVGVKDEEGNIMLVSYDSKTGEYKLYNEFTFDIMNLYIHEKENSEYEKIKLSINGISTTGYKIDGVDEFCLVYATNTITGYEGYYIYDKKENSVQRYDTTAIDSVTNTKDKFLSMVLVLSCVCFLTMLFLLIEVNRDNKRNTEE